MTAKMSFDSTKKRLEELLKDIKSGKLQLPDFQREWIWDDEHIRSLLASVSMSYPIGIIMTLETGGESNFKPRLVDGVDLVDQPSPDRLILDGQQRLTSLFLSLFSGKPVRTRDTTGKTVKRWYYVDMAKALSSNGDEDEAIVSLHEDRRIRNFRGEVIQDYSTIERECEAEMFPLPLVFRTAGWHTWIRNYVKTHPENDSKLDEFAESIVQRFQNYEVPVILLTKETPKDAVCNVFEKVNTGGVALTVFELLTAIYAADEYSLRDDWSAKQKHFNQHQYKVLSGTQNTDFLQTVTLLATYAKAQDTEAAVSCKRKDVLRLDLENYKSFSGRAVTGYKEAARLLYSQNIFATRDLPYRTQLIPLAAILAVLGKDGNTEGSLSKITKWFWCGVFGEMYGGATETRFARDLPEVVGWVRGGGEPLTIQDAHFAPNRILTLRTRNSAAYKGLSALLLRNGARDFRAGKTIDAYRYFDDSVDIHHIFPQAYCKEQGIAQAEYDCIVNKTLLSSHTNRIIGSNAPSKYLARLQRQAELSDDALGEILVSHAIDPTYLLSDDFDNFFESRKNALLKLIERTMEKPLSGEEYSL
jgi:hypothetical protein